MIAYIAKPDHSSGGGSGAVSVSKPPATPEGLGVPTVAPAASASVSQPTGQAATQRPNAMLDDYGEKVRAAINSADARDALDAALLIKTCLSIDEKIESAYHAKSLANIPTDVVNGLIEQWQIEQRRCQTVTSNMLSKRPELARKALLGNVQGAAIEYLSSVRFKPPTEDVALVRAGLEVDAKAGDSNSAKGLALAGEALGLNALERRKYQLVVEGVNSNGARETAVWPDLVRPQSLSHEQEREARAQAEELLRSIAEKRSLGR
ncbi:MAG: hypothetical protein U1E77_00525 [Inhella sp.]